MIRIATWGEFGRAFVSVGEISSGVGEVLVTTRFGVRTTTFPWLQDIPTPDYNPRLSTSDVLTMNSTPLWGRWKVIGWEVWVCSLLESGRFNPAPLNPRLFNYEISTPYGSGVDEFMVEKSGVEKSGFKKFVVGMSCNLFHLSDL